MPTNTLEYLVDCVIIAVGEWGPALPAACSLPLCRCPLGRHAGCLRRSRLLEGWTLALPLPPISRAGVLMFGIAMGSLAEVVANSSKEARQAQVGRVACCRGGERGAC